MFKLEDIIVNAEMIAVLAQFKLYLQERGIERFAIFKPNGNNIQTNCPFHKQGQERKPSFGINIHNGSCHCFACGWSGSLQTMIGELLGKDENFGSKWIIKHFTSTEVETRQKLLELPTQRTLNQIKNLRKNYVTEEELDSYRYYHPYMFKRGLTEELINEFDIGYDEISNEITFPIEDEHGQGVIWVARRSVKGKMYKYPQGVDKPVYAINRITSDEVYVTESFFNCLTLWKLGLQAVALMGTGTTSQYEQLKNCKARTLILALDPDEAGQRATYKIKKYLGPYKLFKRVIYTEPDKDINDLQEKFLDLDVIIF